MCCLIFKICSHCCLLSNVSGTSNLNGDCNHAGVVKGLKKRVGLKLEMPLYANIFIFFLVCMQI